MFIGDTPWVKKGENNFDVAMGAWDGAESTDLVGLFMLYEMRNLEADQILACTEMMDYWLQNVPPEILRNSNKKYVPFSIHMDSK